MTGTRQDARRKEVFMKRMTRHWAYRNYRPETLSDSLALDQFLLAIERNFLLHIATGLNMTVVGLAMFRFFSRHPNDLYAGIGLASFGVALLIAGKGLYDYLRMRSVFGAMEEDLERKVRTG
jgi:putative membrane protein